MAATEAAARLTEAHRLAQARLGVQTVLRMRTIWPLLNPRDLNATYRQWLAAAVPVVQGQRATSAHLAASYLNVFKVLELGPAATVAPVLAEVVELEALTTSLVVTGPVSVKRAMERGVPLVQALDTAQATSSAAAMRHALDGGRGTILDTLAFDRQALGWARAASGHACAFCAMLASRGPVYREETVDFQAHDHCSCSAEPVYRQGGTWPSGSDRYRDMWEQAKAAPGDTVPEFRHLVESA